MSTKKEAQAAPKKTTPSTSKPVELKEGQFKATKIGANFSASIVGSDERYAKKVTKEEAENLIKEITAYNKRPSEAKKGKIVALLTPEKTKLQIQREGEVAKVKGLKKQVKKAEKTEKVNTDKQEQKTLLQQLEAELTADETQVSVMQAILDKFKKKEEVKPAPVSAAPRRGEY